MRWPCRALPGGDHYARQREGTVCRARQIEPMRAVICPGSWSWRAVDSYVLAWVSEMGHMGSFEQFLTKPDFLDTQMRRQECTEFLSITR
ncbi:MAG: hypothetical protein M0Q13_11195 [Methanothrix sp.]|nr:hypothetical protein [Methanothrix sp.]